ncbi:hypothetical protein GU334_05540 [Lactococcus raffinolactis]|uniref:Uncharacterized protein n=2 Tax=Pseudolactococcus TaxID=3436058 RepID=A0AAE7CSA7_9LACT|nr:MULTISPECIES: hypothetical protein [Lactococcus]MBR2542034.1 hypothetical protein [Lactococcus sp.]PCS06604.1 hypothetical protein RU86_GL000263 [Lactococcus piscium]QIW58399.1 hypothetical protein GU334_05540 [Lactococcus raffinolactis]
MTLENDIKKIASLIYDQLNEDSYLWTYDTMDEMGVPEKLQEEVAEKLFSLASDYDIGLLGVAFEHSDNDGALGYWGLLGCSVDEITIYDCVYEVVEKESLGDIDYTSTFVKNFVSKFNACVDYLQAEESKLLKSLEVQGYKY